CQHSYGAPLTF
nr:immunoglobulin light chain junction region [Macaca mulatta]MOW40813.1 immunoglobulin light chain junction region [Macaca mulatta]MOW41066.1 immunoglobulin light chain junction region [Macaca mulatta]MOW41746.1 immunoglobulin light chain junction region [Macaca mulatta]MOW41822.1 immunoglobulin light chain junction region [Macaca mulatta]